MRLKPCPFCGYKAPKVVLTGAWFVRCQRIRSYLCRAEGPVVVSTGDATADRRSAEAAWNRRQIVWVAATRGSEAVQKTQADSRRKRGRG